MTLSQLQQEARKKVDKLMLGEYEPRTLTRRGEVIDTLIASAYQAGKDAEMERMKSIVTRAKEAIPVEDNGVSRFGRSICDEILLESARNTP